MMKERLNPITEKEATIKELSYSKNEWRIVQCIDTGMVYLQNPPEYHQLIDELAWEKQFSEERARRKAEEPILSLISALIKKIRGYIRKKERIETESAKQIEELLKLKNNKSLTIIDVGCGTGSKLQKIVSEQKNNSVNELSAIGIELSKVQWEEANENLKNIGGYCIHNTAIEGLKEMPDKSADLIILCSFLEHELYPLSLLKVCKSKLNKNGRIIIKVPNFDSLNRKIRQKKWCGFRYPDHVNYFTPKTLKFILLEASLKIRTLDAFLLNDNMWVIAVSDDAEENV